MTTDALLVNMRMFRASIALVYGAKDFTSATVLSFKLFFAVIDYVLLTRKGLSPKDHTERFRLVQKWFPEIYVVLDKDFPIYQDSYTRTIEREVCDRVRGHIDEIVAKYEVPV